MKLTVRYIRKARALVKDHYNKHTGTCAACGCPLWSETVKRKLCMECASMTKKILNRVTYENQTDTKDENITADINRSDIFFVNNYCDDDCLNCKFDDCILPAEED